MEPPGADLVEQGIRDLDGGHATVAALLVSIGSRRNAAPPRELPPALPQPQLRLDERVEEVAR